MNSMKLEHAIKSTTFIEGILMSISMSEELYQAKARKKMLALYIEIHKGTDHYWLKSLCTIEKLKNTKRRSYLHDTTSAGFSLFGTL